MREALDALQDMEEQLVAERQRSDLSTVVENTMLHAPENWMPYYSGTPEEQRLRRRYSYSDRVRYYWALPEVSAAVQKLITNLSEITIPESMLSRYLPAQYWRLRGKQIAGDPESLIVDHIRDVLRQYAAACMTQAG